MNLIEQIKVNDTSIDGYQGTYYSDNPEYVQVTTDSEGKMLEGIKSDGTKYIGGNLIVDGSIYNDSLNIAVEQIAEDIQERVDEILDDAEDTLSYFEPSNNPEWLQVTIDSEGKILGGRNCDGTVIENIGIDTNNISVDSAIFKKAFINDVSINNGNITANLIEFTTTEEKDTFVQYLNVQPSQGFSLIVVDLPVSDGTDILSGYAYIDSFDRCVKVKA